MAGMAPRDFVRYLLRGRYPRRAGLLCPQCVARPAFRRDQRLTYTTASRAPPTTPLPVPLRKQMKDAAKARKEAAAAAGGSGVRRDKNKSNRAQTVPGWELTVGIEIHAQLNTERKLFSAAAATDSASPITTGRATSGSSPNTHVAYFDAALPGAQPIFQAATLVPAVRAALALGCRVQRVSRFDRKHYFHWDQPSGYQITQFYEPFARGGVVDLFARDGIAAEDGEHVRIAIQQVQMEQDTAKTVAQQPSSSLTVSQYWIDFNRVGMPLIEIITAPELHHPATAAALVRKIQLLLHAVDACTSGMEAGGLRADVNVSVRRTDGGDQQRPLGVRTEIKNLNSFRAVEDAIIAERNRQIAAIEAAEAAGMAPDEAAQVIVSETRGWTPAGTGSGPGNSGGETHRLRGKEGETDYRYMPDPDLGPVVIDDALVQYLQLTLGVSPDAELEDLVAHYGLTETDAVALMLLDGGGRAQYYYDVAKAVEVRLASAAAGGDVDRAAVRAFVANWVLHQLGRLTSEKNTDVGSSADSGSGGNDLGMTPEGRCSIPVSSLADILAFRFQRRITASVAKELLYAVFRGDVGGDDEGQPTGGGALYNSVTDAIDKGGLWFDEISPGTYNELAEQALAGEEKTLQLFVDFANAEAEAARGGKPLAKKSRYPQGKLQFLIGKVMRLGQEGRTDPQNAEAAVRAAIERHVEAASG